MKNLLILIAFLTVAAKAERPAWVNSDKTMWSANGKIYVMIHVENKDLDFGMHLTESRFREVLAADFCTESPCVYHNFTREGSYWETGIAAPNFDIYRLFSIKDTTK